MRPNLSMRLNHKILQRVLLFLMCCLPSLPLSVGAFEIELSVKQDRHLVLGVYAYQDEDAIRQRFQGLADYLSKKLPNITVSLEVMDAKSMRLAVRDGRVDLLLPNPVLYEVLRNEGDLGGVIATLELMDAKGFATSRLGGVIFSQAKNADIKSIEDLRGRLVAVPGRTNTGAYLIPLSELASKGIAGSQLNFVFVGDNDAVIGAVLEGRADAGFVRTGVLEDWFDQQGLNPKQLHILNQRFEERFPYLLSTRLYPEWPFVVSKQLDIDLVRQVSVALYSIKASDEVAKRLRIAGFVPPQDYLPVEKLLREHRLPPYDEVPEFSLAEAINAHPMIFVVGLAVIMVLSFAFIASNVLRARIKEKTDRFEDLLFATQAVTWDWTLESDLIEVNHNWGKLLGYSQEELKGFTAAKLWLMVHSGDVECLQAALKTHLSNASEYLEVEFRIRHKASHWIWVMARGRVVSRDANGTASRMMGTFSDIDEMKRKEITLEFRRRRDQVLLDLPTYIENMEEQAFMQYAQELTEQLTDSKISFIHFLNDDQQSIELVAWSKRTLEEYCQVPELETHYPLESAGIWADAARDARPVLINDYVNYPDKKGLPHGHAPLERLISVPVMEKGKVVMMTGVGNKPFAYGEQDVETVQLISNEIWRLVQRKRNQQRIFHQTERFQRLVNDLGPEHVVFSHSGSRGKMLYISDTVQNVFGILPEAIIGKSWAEVVQWEEASMESAMGYLNAIMSGLEDYNQFDMRFTHAVDQSSRVVHISQHAVRDESGNLVSINGLAVNITHQREAERKLQEAARVFEHAQEGILIANSKGLIVNVNAAFTRITGFHKADVLGKNPNVLSSGKQSREFYRIMWEKLLTTGNWQGEFWNRRKNGEFYPQKINITTVRDQEGSIQQFIALFSDISVEKRQQAELEFIAHFDPLTNLPNRVLLTDRLIQAISYTDRHKMKLAVVFIDLDGFKSINDSYGHAAGDRLLEMLALRFKHSIRKGDTISRVGGDEFVGVFPDVESRASVEPILQRLLDDSVRPFEYQEVEIAVSASIGVVIYDGLDEGVSADLLIRHADQAMYQAKMAGKNQIAYFDAPSLHTQMNAQEKRQRLNEIEQAMNNHEFELFYQPKLHTHASDVVAFEALIRWRQPNRGIVPPVFFLPELENESLGIRLGYWVIEEALRQLERWLAQGIDCSISVNVSGYELQQPNFVSKIQELLGQYSEVDASCLMMELLESSALEDIDKVSGVINEIRGFGVRFAIDDFGSGYASLNYLKRLPVDELKIDQSFIKDIFERPQGLAILESVISMSKAFNVQVVAEGVETHEHIQLLRRLRFEVLQGYAISRPMPAEQVTTWVQFGRFEALELEEVSVLDREGVMQMMAVLEHRSWFARLEGLLSIGSSESVDVFSVAQCGFGKWLYSSGQRRLSKEVFAEVERLHNRVHVLAEKVVHMIQSGSRTDAVMAFEELKSVEDLLISQLHEED